MLFYLYRLWLHVFSNKWWRWWSSSSQHTSIVVRYDAKVV